ncbi:MAG TPA: maleylpyruvate isomerase family mycothiol-dependent enzyme [Streptosporangiaceae bacterium]|nr:maleylpyruvate isomerase family mycothiol-dependent enzyme [Streptosporangiaceae bacterium]
MRSLRSLRSLRSSRSLRDNERVEIAEHIEALRSHGGCLADAAALAGLEAAVPPCPPWRVKDLLRHTGYIHRWAARHLTEQPGQILDGPPEREILASGATDAELIGWFRAGHAALVSLLESADPGLRTATFMATAATPVGFWARRQAHETAIHRADADAALGVRTSYPVAFAVDGIDELITGFGNRGKYRPPGDADGLAVRAADTGGEWVVRSVDGRSVASREAAPDASCVVTGAASDLYLFLWNRHDSDVTVTGDARVLDTWRSAMRVRWE